MNEIHHVDQLLALHDRAFVEGAYRWILGRPSDEGGMEHYLGRVREGDDKIQIVTEFARSEEGKKRVRNLPGLPELMLTASRRGLRGWLFSARRRNAMEIRRTARMENDIGRVLSHVDGLEGRLLDQLSRLRNNVAEMKADLDDGGFDRPTRAWHSGDRAGSWAPSNTGESQDLGARARRIYLRMVRSPKRVS